jgi:hypothetical protein
VLSDGFAIYPGTGEKEFSSVSYNYETDSMLAEKIYGNKVTTSYDYLPRNWVQSILSEIPGSSRTISENYNYDDAGNLIELFESDNTNQKKTGFIYDNLYRLKEAYPIDLGLGFESKGGRYKDLMNYTYDPVGNMLKSNGISMITESTSNKLNHAEIPGVGTTDYTYDNYGNLKTKSGWQEIEYASIRSVGGPPPEHTQQAELIFKGSDKKESNENEKIVSFEGTASSAAGEGTFYFYEGGEPYRLEIYGIDAKPGDTIKIVHTATEIPYTYNEYPFRGTYVWQTTVEEYTGVLGPYCDSGSSGEFTTTCDPKDKYKTFARIGGGYGQLISGSPPNAIYEDDPKIPQYFHVYEDKTTNYCFDYANRLTHWWETVNSETRNCMVFEYDNTGSRIEKTEIKEYEGNALLFNGQNNYVYIGDSFNSLVIPFTIEAWVNTAGSTQFKPIFVSDDNPSDTGNVYGIYFQIDSQNKLEITYAAGTGSGSSGRRTKTSNNAIPLNQWVHIAAVVVSDGSSPVIRLYVNGNEVAGTASGTGGNLAHNSYVAVIGKKTRYSGYFNGKIDDVRIWNDVRTIDEIKQNMNIELESGDNLVAYWKMNEGQGTSIEDSAGTSDGSLRNGVVWSTRHQKIGYTTYYITQGGSTIYEKYYKLPDFTCPSSCDYGGQQLLQPPPGQEISSVQQKTTAPSNDLNSAIQKAGAAIGKFLSPFVG